jgi:glutamate-ammonia-ligase adenylyltransferase
VDVEFAVQYLQLKQGCRYPELRTTSTIIALKEIRTLGLLPEGDAEALLTGFKFLRKLENRLRIIHDYSVNDLSGPKSYMDKLARRLGYDPRLKNPGATLISDYEETTGRIRDCYARILGEQAE